MRPVIGINSSSAPFMTEIGAGLKTLETRSRNTLGRFVGKRVMLAETKQGGYLAMYTAIIRAAHRIDSPEAWEALRPLHRVPVGSKYDWKPDTRVKWAYEITSLRRLCPFRVPEGRRHGRVWMEYEPPLKQKILSYFCAGWQEDVIYNLADREHASWGYVVYGSGSRSNALYEIRLDDDYKVVDCRYMF